MTGGRLRSEFAGAERELLERLRSAAVEYAGLGWPVLPLSPAGDQVVAGMSPRDAEMAADWWSEQPYGIGVRVGERFDVLEMPAVVGEQVLAELLRRLRLPVPVFEVPWRGWLLLVTPGSPRIQELGMYRRAVRLHRRGGWVPLPPTPVVGGAVRWVSRGQFPHSLTAQMSVFLVLRRLGMFTPGES